MKITSKISALLLAASLTACLQAHATAFTESIDNIDTEIVGPSEAYTGTFTLAGLSGFSNNDIIQSVVIELTMLNASGNPVYLAVDSHKQKDNDTSNPQTLSYTMTGTQDSYITAQFALNGEFTYSAYADCELGSAELIVNATTPSTSTIPNGSSVPDMATTVLLLGSTLLGLEVLRRKSVPAKACPAKA